MYFFLLFFFCNETTSLRLELKKMYMPKIGGVAVILFSLIIFRSGYFVENSENGAFVFILGIKLMS